MTALIRFGLENADAEDVAQTAVAAAWLATLEGRRPRSGIAWLSTVSTRHARRALRRRVSLGADALEPDTLAGEEVGQESAAVLSDEVQAALREVDRLPARHRRLMRLIFVSGDVVEGMHLFREDRGVSRQAAEATFTEACEMLNLAKAGGDPRRLWPRRIR